MKAMSYVYVHGYIDQICLRLKYMYSIDLGYNQGDVGHNIVTISPSKNTGQSLGMINNSGASYLQQGVPVPVFIVYYKHWCAYNNRQIDLYSPFYVLTIL